MLIGYARTSTLEQNAGLEAQRESLKGNSCERLFEEQVSSTAFKGALREALSFCREGDTLVVTKLDNVVERHAKNAIRSFVHLSRASWGDTPH